MTVIRVVIEPTTIGDDMSELRSLALRFMAPGGSRGVGRPGWAVAQVREPVRALESAPEPQEDARLPDARRADDGSAGLSPVHCPLSASTAAPATSAPSSGHSP